MFHDQCCLSVKMVRQWNLAITKRLAKCSLQRGFVVWRFFSIHFTIAAAKKIVRYTDRGHRDVEVR